MSRLKLTAVLAFVLSILPVFASWEILDMPTDRGFGAIWAINEQTIFVSGHHGLWKTFDGANWELDTIWIQPPFIYFTDDTLGFLKGSILTIDGGKTWQKGDTVNGNVGPLSFPQGQSLIGYGLGLYDVRMTTDGGWHWNELPSFPDVYPGFDEEILPRKIWFARDPDTGYVTADLLKILSHDPFDVEPHYSFFKTTDGGQTWILNEEGLWNDDFSPYLVDFPENASVGYMKGGGGKVFKTTDGGETWDTVFRTPEGYPNIYDISFPESDQVGYVLNDTMIHKTTDGGKTWRTFGLGQDTVFLRCHFLNDSVGFISGTGTTAYNSLNPYTPGFVMKTTDGLLGIAENDWVDVEPENLQVISPIGRKVVLRYSNQAQGFHVQVFNALGRRVDELHSSQTSGIVTWGEGEPSGVYFIRPVGAGNPRPLRVVLVR
ncbi:hypothetical protein JXM67_13170 [candidate division WOR-3 bacterium]|nr:hypothetical protein [candidate division WOR-3 bacterium]